jgi:DNA polymerase-3 subunit delta'
MAGPAKRLERALASGKLPPTWLIHGAEGTGKWALAMELAAAILCPNRGPWACTICPSCQRFQAFGHSGLFMIYPFPTGGGTGKARTRFQEEYTETFFERKKAEPLLPVTDQRNRYIPAERVTELLSWASLKPAEGQHKVALVYEPEQIVRTVTDKLLKLTEEPPADTSLILVSHKVDSLPQTIRSRSRQVHVARLGPRALESYLTGVGHPVAKVTAAVRGSRGLIGPALARLGELQEGDPQAESLSILTGLLDASPRALSEIQMWQWKAERQRASDALDVWAVMIRDLACGDVADPLLGNAVLEFSKRLPHIAKPRRAAVAQDEIRSTQAALATNVHIGVALVALSGRLARLGRGQALGKPFWPDPQTV